MITVNIIEKGKHETHVGIKMSKEYLTLIINI